MLGLNLRDAIEKVVKYDLDLLIICLDGDDDGVAARKNTVHDAISNYFPEFCKYEVFVLNKCAETWLMGNRKIFTGAPSPDFTEYWKYYNINIYDPELMDKPIAFSKSTSIYHEKYLKNMLKEKQINYKKSNPPKEVKSEYYLNELRKRIEMTTHLNSFKTFVDFFCKLHTQA